MKSQLLVYRTQTISGKEIGKGVELPYKEEAGKENTKKLLVALCMRHILQNHPKSAGSKGLNSMQETSKNYRSKYKAKPLS